MKALKSMVYNMNLSTIDKTEFKQLQQAIKNHQIISFHYRKYNQETAQRIVEPYLLVNRNGIWYLIALEMVKKKLFASIKSVF